MRTSAPLHTPFPYQDFQQALTTVLTALRRGPAYALVLGASGSGKTSLLRLLAAQLQRRDGQVLYLLDGQTSAATLVRIMAENFHLPTRRTSAETARLLLHTLRAQATRLLLVLDEAQLLPDATLQQLRLLAEADLDAPALFSVVLCALPTLQPRLLTPAFAPLWRRLRPRVTLTGLRRDELPAFLTHHFGPDAAARFAPQALELLFEQAAGLPALLREAAAEALRANPKGTLNAAAVTAALDPTPGH